MDKWFISTHGVIYDYPEVEQAIDFPEDDHTAYDTYEAAQAAQRAMYRQWCDAEFGEDHDHDDAECARILDTMNGDMSFYDYPSYDYQDAHYERFGRPAFPNEY